MAVSVPVLVLLPAVIAGLLSYSDAVASFPPACHKYNVSGCTRQYRPVCGTDGKTYPNECMLCVSNSENKKDVQIFKNGICQPTVKKMRLM